MPASRGVHAPENAQGDGVGGQLDEADLLVQPDAAFAPCSGSRVVLLLKVQERQVVQRDAFAVPVGAGPLQVQTLPEDGCGFRVSLPVGVQYPKVVQGPTLAEIVLDL